MHDIHSAILLAGGLGTRLRPLTLTTPKPLVPVQGRTLIEMNFDILRKFGITDVTLCVGYLADTIKAYIGDGSRFGLRVSYCVEHEPLGTGGAIAQVRRPQGTTLVMNSDNLYDIDLNDVYNKHKASGALVTDMLTQIEDPTKSGVVRLEGEKIIEFVEKPKLEDAPSRLINAGYYLFEPSVWDHLPKGKCSLEKDVFPLLARDRKMNAFIGTGQWFPTDTPELLAQVNNKWVPVR